MSSIKEKLIELLSKFSLGQSNDKQVSFSGPAKLDNASQEDLIKYVKIHEQDLNQIYESMKLFSTNIVLLKTRLDALEKMLTIPKVEFKKEDLS